MKDYLDFRVHIAQGSGEDFEITLTTPAGTSKGTLHFPFDPASLEIALLTVERAVADSREMQQSSRAAELDVDITSVTSFGQNIFNALFTKEVEDAFRASQTLAQSADKGLRIRLSIEPARLACLPWEFLYDSSVGDFLCLSSYTPIVRYMEFERPLSLLKVESPLRMLAMISSPVDLPKLDVQNEKARIMEATRFLQNNGLLKIDWLEKGSTYDALQKGLRRKDVDYHIFHFVGHGGFDRIDDEGVLVFEREDQTKHEISSRDIGRLLADEKSLRLVVLNSCLGAKGSATNALSSTAASLVRRGVPSVVAMQYRISDRAAIAFSRELYEAIAEGLPVDAAVSEARKSVSVEVRKSVEWATPVLYTRTPDGVLFTLDGPKPSEIRKTIEFPAPVPDPVPAPVPDPVPVPVPAPPRPPDPDPVPAPSSRRAWWLALAAVVVIGGSATAYKLSNDAAIREKARADSTAAAAAADAAARAAAARVAERERAPAVVPRAGLTMRMVTIPGGSFTMGSNEFPTTRPTHEVQVPSFALGEHEVTVGEFQTFADSNPTWRSTTPGCMSDERTQRAHADWSWTSHSFPQDSLHPVVCVSVRDALAFMSWLNKRDTTAHYRLPSEAEWEYAARAGTTTRQYWTDPNETCKYAVSAERPPLCELQGASRGTQRVSGRQPNAFGLHDMLGNAQEWTQDCWNSSYSGAPVNGEPWRAGSCSHHVVRGGAWPHSLREVQAAFRVRWDVNLASNLTGFRVARSLPSATQ